MTSRNISPATPAIPEEAEASAPADSIFVGCDHAALDAKHVVLAALAALGLGVEDVGTHTAESVDYPDVAARVTGPILEGNATRGILLCGTGIGMAIAANKVPGIRAALVHDVYSAEMSRLHNNSNVLVLGGGMLGPRLIEEIVKTWIGTNFEGGRHQRRLDKIEMLDGERNAK